MTPTYSVHPTPIGEALLVHTEEGLVALSLFDGPVYAEVARLALLLREVPRPDDEAGAAVAAELDEYFRGERRTFTAPLDERLVDRFPRRALRAVRDIPFGETASYGEVAVRAGSPGASRAVGTACARTPWSIVVPVHRVVRSDGHVGAYGHHPERKRFLLDLEAQVGARGV